MNADWSGLPERSCRKSLEFLDDQEICSAASSARRRTITAAPYSLTEEFVAVYRMHPLIPDEVRFHSLATGGLLETRNSREIAGRNARPAIAERVTMPDLFYSFGMCHPGAITLHNYPKHLQNLAPRRWRASRPGSRRHPPRPRARRAALQPVPPAAAQGPVKSFDELTDNPEWREQIKQVYNNDLEKVDLMTGLFAEPLPEGFGFSETAFRIFLLMASRRLKSDRFFTDDYRPEIYTEFGLDYIKQNTMLTVLKRHYPAVAAALNGVENAFHPWNRLHDGSISAHEF